MTKRDILSISLKILGVFSIIYAVRQIPYIALTISMFIPQSGQGLSSIWYLIGIITSIILAFVIAYILLRWGDSIAKKLVRKDSKIPSLNEKEWEKPIFILSLRVVGVLCLIRGIQELIKYLIRFTSLGEKPGFLTAQNWGGVISTIVVLIISVYLISGAKKFVKFLLR